MENEPPSETFMSRKRFIALTAASIAATGCQSVGGGATTSAKPSKVIDAGPAGTYAEDGVYENFRENGFFLIRSKGKLTAMSSYCTHRRCKLDAEPDHSFSCPCHDSTFDPSGKVTEGPATRDLPGCPLQIDPRGHVMVTV